MVPNAHPQLADRGGRRVAKGHDISPSLRTHRSEDGFAEGQKPCASRTLRCMRWYRGSEEMCVCVPRQERGWPSGQRLWQSDTVLIHRRDSLPSSLMPRAHRSDHLRGPAIPIVTAGGLHPGQCAATRRENGDDRSGRKNRLSTSQSRTQRATHATGADAVAPPYRSGRSRSTVLTNLSAGNPLRKTASAPALVASRTCSASSARMMQRNSGCSIRQ